MFLVVMWSQPFFSHSWETPLIDLQLSLPESGNGLKMTFHTGSQGTVINFSELIRDLKPVSLP